MFTAACSDSPSRLTAPSFAVVVDTAVAGSNFVGDGSVAARGAGRRSSRR